MDLEPASRRFYDREAAFLWHLPLPQWRRLEPGDRAELAAHLRVRAVRQSYESAHDGKEPPKENKPFNMVEQMGGVRK